MERVAKVFEDVVKGLDCEGCLERLKARVIKGIEEGVI